MRAHLGGSRFICIFTFGGKRPRGLYFFGGVEREKLCTTKKLVRTTNVLVPLMKTFFFSHLAELARMSRSCKETPEGCCEGISRLQVNDDEAATTKVLARRGRSKGETRGQKGSGLTHECGVFGCIAAGDWPSSIDVGQVICLGECGVAWGSIRSWCISGKILI